MRKLIPIRGSVVCTRVCGGTKTLNRCGITFKVDQVDIYRIKNLPEILPENGFEFKVGDLVMSNSTGDEIEINPGETVYLFKMEHIMCKVDENAAEEKTVQKDKDFC